MYPSTFLGLLFNAVSACFSCSVAILLKSVPFGKKRLINPFVFSLDGSYQFSNHYNWKINVSKNYRVPTINDLFWQPGGNLDLVPESSYQLDFGQEFNYKSLGAKLNGYYIKTKDMIQWIPDNTGLFRPRNINEVINYGVEVEVFLKHNFAGHQFNLNSNYSYTVSENEIKRIVKSLIFSIILPTFKNL